MTEKYYKTKHERTELIKRFKILGKSMLHDDFLDENNNSTDGKSGRLTFGHFPPIPERVIKSLDELNLLLFKKEISYIELLDLLTLQAISPTRWERFRALFG